MIPAVEGKLTGMVFRVPTIDVSVVDLLYELDEETVYAEICAEIKKRAEGDLTVFYGSCEEPHVPTDSETNHVSSTFDANVGIMLDRPLLQLWHGTMLSGATPAAWWTRLSSAASSGA